MTNLPTDRDLKKLCLRAAVAFGLRAARRVESLLADNPSSDSNAELTDRRLFNISSMLVQAFCNDTLNCENSRIADLNIDKKWDSGTHEEIYDPVLREGEDNAPVLKSGSRIYSAALHARFGHCVEPNILTYRSANKVISLVSESLASAFEAAVSEGSEYKSSFLEEVWLDYDLLISQSTALFPEYGTPIDVSITGPLGPLWRKEKPSPKPVITHENDYLEDTTPNERAQSSDLKSNTPASVEAPLPKGGYLYKYVTFDTLQKILLNKTLRFSFLKDFNDPFDGQLLPVRKFGWTQFFSALRDEVAELVTTNKESIYQFPDDIPEEAVIAAVANIINEFFDGDKNVAITSIAANESDKVEPLSALLRPMIYLAQHGKLGSPEKALKMLNGLLDLFQNHRIPFSLQEADRRIIEGLADIIRVLCLSEVPDSLLMWAHYAEDHTGAVLKFDTQSERAGYFATAKPIIYASVLPGIDHPRSVARRYLGLAAEGVDHTLRQFFTKSAEWEYEKEWRILATTEMSEQGNFIPFRPEALVAIYLGCRVKPSNIRKIIDLMNDAQYQSDVYVAVKDDFEFALNFVPVLNGKARSNAEASFMTISERESLYRSCLDAYLTFWSEPVNGDLRGERKRLRLECMLQSYGPLDSHNIFRKMVEKLHETAAAGIKITADKESEPQEHQMQLKEILEPSAKFYRALEDALKTDLISRGGALQHS